MGKDAQELTGFNYPAGGGDDIGVYKQPMESKERKEMNTVNGPSLTQTLKISVGNVSKGMLGATNPFGKEEMRGYGAATKGRKISGKQG